MNPIILAVTTNDPSIIAGAVVVVIAAIGGCVVQIINAVAASRERQAAAAERRDLLNQTKGAVESSKENGKKADKLIESTGAIYAHTNSINSNLQKTNEVLAEKISGMEKMIAQLTQDKLIASSKTETPVPTEPAAQKILKSIDTNTEETAKNTAKTDASMEEMKGSKKK